jgi:transcriptional regulator with XRE-family HTH domain
MLHLLTRWGVWPTIFAMASLGQELKRERELRGISLREIADSTRISLRLLQALEEDHLEMIPGKFFVRAILRSYARILGLDENQFLNKYQERLLFEEYALDKQPKKRLTPPQVLTPKRLLVLLAILIVTVIAALLYFFVLSSQGENRVRRQQNPAPQAQALAPPPPRQQVETAVEKPAVEEVKGLTLDVTFLEETWIQLYADGKTAWDGVKSRGESLQVKAEQELVINLGNAGGLTFTINGIKAKPLGPTGAVRKDIRITLDNYREYLLPEEKNKG